MATSATKLHEALYLLGSRCCRHIADIGNKMEIEVIQWILVEEVRFLTHMVIGMEW